MLEFNLSSTHFYAPSPEITENSISSWPQPERMFTVGNLEEYLLACQFDTGHKLAENEENGSFKSLVIRNTGGLIWRSKFTDHVTIRGACFL